MLEYKVLKNLYLTDSWFQKSICSICMHSSIMNIKWNIVFHFVRPASWRLFYEIPLWLSIWRFLDQSCCEQTDRRKLYWLFCFPQVLSVKCWRVLCTNANNKCYNSYICLTIIQVNAPYGFRNCDFSQSSSNLYNIICTPHLIHYLQGLIDWPQTTQGSPNVPPTIWTTVNILGWFLKRLLHTLVNLSNYS